MISSKIDDNESKSSSMRNKFVKKVSFISTKINIINNASVLQAIEEEKDVESEESDQNIHII